MASRIQACVKVLVLSSHRQNAIAAGATTEAYGR
jgi:hypothetical protein